MSYEATHCGERGQLAEFISPMRSEIMYSLYEMIHVCTASRMIIAVNFQLKQLERKEVFLTKLLFREYYVAMTISIHCRYFSIFSCYEADTCIIINEKYL